MRCSSHGRRGKGNEDEDKDDPCFYVPGFAQYGRGRRRGALPDDVVPRSHVGEPNSLVPEGRPNTIERAERYLRWMEIDPNDPDHPIDG